MLFGSRFNGNSPMRFFKIFMLPFKFHPTRSVVMEGEGSLSKTFSFNDETKRLIMGVRAHTMPDNSERLRKGLINFEKKEMILGEEDKHEKIAKRYNLQIRTVDEKNNPQTFLQKGWYGFSIDCSNIEASIVFFNRKSGYYGSIPGKYAPAFEALMIELFHDYIEEYAFTNV